MILSSPIDTPGMSFATVAGIIGQLSVLVIVGGATASLGLSWMRLQSRYVPPSEGGVPSRQVWLGAPERWLLAVAGFAVFSVLCMVLNIVTAGAFFGSRIGAPVLAAVVLVLWLRQLPLRNRWFFPERQPTVQMLWRFMPLLLLGAALFTIFILPVLLAGSSVRTGDPPWHLGWTEQLLHGEGFPSGPAPEFGRNAYPWGLHAIMGTLVRLVPATTPLISLETLHVAIVIGIPLAAACLARLVSRSAGISAAAAAALVAGFGWLGDEPFFATSPSEGAFGADLVVASPNSAYELFAPALPRELGLVLIATAVTLLGVYRSTHEARVPVAAGVIAGVAGLVSVPMLVVVLVWFTFVSVAHRGGRRRLFFFTAGTATGVFLLWSGYALAQAFQNGGFVSITPRLGMEWPVQTAFGAWGLLLPVAVVGVVVAARTRPDGARILWSLLGGSLVLLALAILRGVFDWALAGNATLLHQGRVWPAVHLVGAAFAGFALDALVRKMKERSEIAAAVVAAVFIAGMASLLVAREGLLEVMENRLAGYEYASPDIRDEDGFLRRAAPFLGPKDIVEVDGSDRLAFRLFEFSGVKMASFDDARLGANDLRIRYVALAEAWDERISEGGFTPNFRARPGEPQAISGEAFIVSGTFGGELWSLYLVR